MHPQDDRLSFFGQTREVFAITNLDPHNARVQRRPREAGTSAAALFK
ncbi:MAG: hypothetical protein ACREXS_14680 [Gammaproteobacteria bacterium]